MVPWLAGWLVWAGYQTLPIFTPLGHRSPTALPALGAHKTHADHAMLYVM